jgi:hypothetical protein
MDDEIEPVEQRTRDPGPVAPPDRGTTVTWPPPVPEEATGAGVGRSQQLKRGREIERHPPSRHGDDAFLEWLAQGVEMAPGELGKLV